jgi:hypothetical protein
MYPCCGYTLFWSFQPFRYSALPIYPQSLPIFSSFQYTSLCSLSSQILCFTILLMLFLFSFPSFPEFHIVVPLIQTCSTYEFVYNHVCFCAYVYLWIYLPHMRESMQPLSFWAWITSLNMMSSNCIHLPSNHMSFLMTE